MTRPEDGIERPILVFGMPRSGTTWIGKIFDSHPDTLYRHEPDSYRCLSGVPLLPSIGDAEMYAEIVRDYIRAVPSMCTTRTCGKRPLFKKSYESEAVRQWAHLSLLIARVGERFVANFPVMGMTGHVGVNGRLVWKSIESLGRLGVLLETLGSARGIHIVRHPCGYIASVLRGEASRKFTDSRPSGDDYGILSQLMETDQARRRGLSIHELKYMEPIERLAWRWLLFNEKAMEEAERSGRSMVVRYEDVCVQPEQTVRALFRFADLEWSPETTKFLRSSTAKDKGAYYSIVKDPLHAANKWKEELESKAIDKILGITQMSKVGNLYRDPR